MDTCQKGRNCNQQKVLPRLRRRFADNQTAEIYYNKHNHDGGSGGRKFLATTILK